MLHLNNKTNNMSQQNLNITMDKTTPIVCDECGCETFNQVTFLRKVSKFIAGTDQDALIPIPSFACTNCHHVNDEFQPKNLGV